MTHAPIDAIEQAIIDQFSGRITRQQAIDRIRSVIDVTELGAANILDHPTAPRWRYEQVQQDALDEIRGITDRRRPHDH